MVRTQRDPPWAVLESVRLWGAQLGGRRCTDRRVCLESPFPRPRSPSPCHTLPTPGSARPAAADCGEPRARGAVAGRPAASLRPVRAGVRSRPRALGRSGRQSFRTPFHSPSLKGAPPESGSKRCRAPGGSELLSWPDGEVRRPRGHGGGPGVWTGAGRRRGAAPARSRDLRRGRGGSREVPAGEVGAGARGGAGSGRGGGKGPFWGVPADVRRPRGSQSSWWESSGAPGPSGLGRGRSVRAFAPGWGC